MQLLQLVHGRHDEIGALADHARRAARARRRRLRRPRRRRPARPRVPVPPHGRAPPPALRRAADPPDPVRRARPHAPRARARLPRQPGADRARARSRPSTASTSARCAAIHERLFFAPLLETLAGTGPLSPEAAEERLAAFGFTDVERTRAAVRELAAGLTRRSRRHARAAPGHPRVAVGDARPRPRAAPAAAAGRGTGAVGVPGGRPSATRPAPPSAPATSSGRAGSSATPCGATRSSSTPLDDDDDARGREPRAPSSSPTRFDTLEWRGDQEQRREGLRRFKRRELLRIATRDLLGYAPARGDRARAHRRWPRRASRPRSASLRPPVPFAVIGMGRLGGGELSYASDIDVMFVYDGDSADDFHARRAGRRAARAGDRRDHRRGPDLPHRRPRCGPRATRARWRGRSAASATYYEQWGLTWERQALTKARFVAGDADARRALRRARRPSSRTDAR